MISININEKTREDDWGFYVDIENGNFNNYDNYKKMKEKYGLNKKIINPTLECNNMSHKLCRITKISSTTFLTLLIIYFVFYELLV